MLSYRHAFHAGNHADVLKHYLLSVVLDYFNQKPAPYFYVDTHAGAGMYQLNDNFAQKNAEYENGIARLYTANNLPDSVINFVEFIKNINKNNALNFYPGSPAVAQRFLREADKMRLFELHPSDYKLLANTFGQNPRQTKLQNADGFAGIKAILPPPNKRAVVVIDPPYELKDDYLRVVDCLKDSLKRFATGTYMVWYPLLQRPEPAQMLADLKKLNANNWLNVSLNVQKPSEDGYGMHGSGVFVINPPYTLPATLTEATPVLTKLLAMDSAADFRLDYQIS